MKVLLRPDKRLRYLAITTVYEHNCHKCGYKLPKKSSAVVLRHGCKSIKYYCYNCYAWVHLVLTNEKIESSFE